MPAEPWAQVVDASALGAVLFGEPEAQEVGRRAGRAVLVAPALLRFELANICWKKIRRHPEKRDALLAALGLADDLEIYEVEVRYGEVVELAEREGLTAYDASYLWLARSLDLGLVTLDRALAQAAGNRSAGA
jgi:predicted nucleic acid-binding protein